MFLIFAITGASGLGTWAKGDVAPVLASEFFFFALASYRLIVVAQSTLLYQVVG